MIEKQKIEEILKKHGLDGKFSWKYETFTEDLKEYIKSTKIKLSGLDVNKAKGSVSETIGNLNAITRFVSDLNKEETISIDLESCLKIQIFKLQAVWKVCKAAGILMPEVEDFEKTERADPIKSEPVPLTPADCPFCHEKECGGEKSHQDALVDDENTFTVQVEVDTPIGLRRNSGGEMTILHNPSRTVRGIRIYYCPMCGRRLNEPKSC